MRPAVAAKSNAYFDYDTKVDPMYTVQLERKTKKDFQNRYVSLCKVLGRVLWLKFTKLIERYYFSLKRKRKKEKGKSIASG